ncbi:MAG TPA: phosphoglycerate kinase [Candidatus Mailhella merdavium]|nr:phosphoglycerate kinase [Candidatus Mailhella merdavium]
MKALSMNDVDLNGKRVVMRLDLNVPMKNGVISNDKRIRAVLPTIRLALDRGASVIALSHLGRPVEGEFDESFSLRPVAVRLGELLGIPVRFVEDPFAGLDIRPGEVVLCENVRFLKGEKKNNPELAAKLAGLGDVYVMDAFGAAHRAHASTEGAIRAAKQAVAGPLLLAEMEAATQVLEHPTRPLYAIVGGSKVSTKLTVLENLIKHVDGMIVGGGIANTFMLAAGMNMGRSLVEEDLVPEAKRLMELAASRGVKLPLPLDVVVAPGLDQPEKAEVKMASELGPEDCVLDIAEGSVKNYAAMLADAGTIVWNGPLGAFETVPFDRGSRAVAEILAASPAYTLVCGGDSIAAVEGFGLGDKMDYLSTGGGAFMEVLEGKTLPSVAALADRAAC